MNTIEKKLARWKRAGKTVRKESYAHKKIFNLKDYQRTIKIFTDGKNSMDQVPSIFKKIHNRQAKKKLKQHLQSWVSHAHIDGVHSDDSAWENFADVKVKKSVLYDYW